MTSLRANDAGPSLVWPEPGSTRPEEAHDPAVTAIVDVPAGHKVRREAIIPVPQHLQPTRPDCPACCAQASPLWAPWATRPGSTDTTGTPSPGPSPEPGCDHAMTRPVLRLIHAPWRPEARGDGYGHTGHGVGALGPRRWTIARHRRIRPAVAGVRLLSRRYGCEDATTDLRGRVYGALGSLHLTAVTHAEGHQNRTTTKQLAR